MMSNWKPVEIRQLGHDGPLSAVGQIVTEAWNCVAAVPWLIHIPEIDRLMIVVSLGYPHDPTLITSDDGGATWTEPRRILPRDVKLPATNAGAVGLGLTYLGSGRLMLAFHTFQAHSFSEDYGQTWSELLPLGKAPDGNDWYVWDPMLVDKDAAGKVVRLLEGRATFIDDVSRSYVCVSTDQGNTWKADEFIFEDVSELAFGRAANGNLIAACRLTPSDEYKTDLDHTQGLGTAVSEDNGKTWSPVQRLFEFGRHHPSVIQMSGGELVMTYVVRQGYPPTDDGHIQFGIEALVSRDHGHTWDTNHRYVLAQWPANRKDENAWWASSQCTSSVALPNGDILTCYGTGYRSQANAQGCAEPRDVGLLRWRLRQHGE